MSKLMNYTMYKLPNIYYLGEKKINRTFPLRLTIYPYFQFDV